jgi:hypothetical protein
MSTHSTGAIVTDDADERGLRRRLLPPRAHRHPKHGRAPGVDKSRDPLDPARVQPAGGGRTSMGPLGDGWRRQAHSVDHAFHTSVSSS